jgi:hypothetical protein
LANNLNQAEINAIENYSDEIKTLKDFVSACRRMPGMYIGGVSNRGYLSLIREIYQNSVDQLVKPGSPATEVYLYYNMQTLQVTVRDNGLGLPYKDMERILNTQPGFIHAMWCGDEECEARIKEIKGCKSRCIVEDGEKIDTKCVCCGKEAIHHVIWGIQY